MKAYFTETVWHTFEHTVVLLPFLFLTSLLMELIEHKAESKTSAIIEKAGRFGPLLGGLLGALPQCGFSAAASGLYSGRVITLGTLIAVYLSTSDEMAAVMLQRQQASAIIDARKMIVDGAVGMVEMALERLNNGGLVTLDEERKAAMVSNLLVVLCGNRDAQPVVNSGSLY